MGLLLLVSWVAGVTCVGGVPSGATSLSTAQIGMPGELVASFRRRFSGPALLGATNASSAPYWL